MRLDKFIADAGIGSRKEIKQALKGGLVCVNDIPEKNAARHINPETDSITFAGQKIEYKPFVYLMLNKPADTVSATYDNRDATVISLVPEEFSHYELFPVGRLDKDTEGLLLITNDGVLSHNLLSPKKHVDKQYYARLDGQIAKGDSEKFASGIVLDDGYKTLPAILDAEIGSSEAYVTIQEGKFHQVKRMFADVGKHVTYLKRIRFGPLCLDETLAPGEMRELTDEELALLKGE